VAEVTVLIVTWRAREHLTRALAALREQTVPHRLLVVDNASTDGTASLLTSVDSIRLPENRGFAGGVVAGLAEVDTPWVALLNDDAVPAPDWLAALLAAAPGHAAVTSRMLLPDGRVNNVGVRLLPDGYGADRGLGAADGYDEPAEVFGFSGGACLLSTAAVRAVGGFPGPFFLY
jgi:GT2 family glycosyltransferase